MAVDAYFSGTFDAKIVEKGEGGSGFSRLSEWSKKEKIIANHLKYRTRIYMTSAAKEKTPDKSAFAKKVLEGLRTGPFKNEIMTSGEHYHYHLKKANPVLIFGEFGNDEPRSSFLFIKR